MKVVWVTSWDRICGIADYSKILWPSIEDRLTSQKHFGAVISLDQFPTTEELLEELRRQKPDVIHFQHEYGLYGGKNPPKYSFPNLVLKIRESLPKTKICATAHTVISGDYKFPLSSKGWQIPLRLFLNKFVLNRLRLIWEQRTWGALDGVIVHSKLQIPDIQRAGKLLIEEIPHFVPEITASPKGDVALEKHPVLDNVQVVKRPKILVFGFFSPQKGQDFAISAVDLLDIGFDDNPPVLILAGGVRIKKDRKYFDLCVAEIKKRGIESSVFITDYVEQKHVSSLYQAADVVLVPFRETSGSGSIAQALARGASIVASDLELNAEIDERVRGSILLYKANDRASAVAVLKELLGDEVKRASLKEKALEYARKFSPQKIAEQHMKFYNSLLQSKN